MKERTYPYREKGQQGQDPGCKVAVGGARGEVSRQIGADELWKEKDQPEEAEAVQSSDGALRFNPVHRLKPRQNLRAEEKQV